MIDMVRDEMKKNIVLRMKIESGTIGALKDFGNEIGQIGQKIRGKNIRVENALELLDKLDERIREVRESLHWEISTIPELTACIDMLGHLLEEHKKKEMNNE